ncbi:hypothetical protein LA080_010467 [Diaporthe eres]|nr:hypothetical protein LA080_010467 [Diaporthe eres]
MARCRSSVGKRSSTNRDIEQQNYLQQQRLDAYMAEPLKNGNRLVDLPYRTIVEEASSLSQGPSLVGQPQELRGVGSWTVSQGGK